MSEHTDGADRATRTREWMQTGVKMNRSQLGNVPVEFPLQRHIILHHVLYAKRWQSHWRKLRQTLLMQQYNPERITAIASVPVQF